MANVYRPAPPQLVGPSCSCSVTSRPLAVHLPAIDGQPSPDSVNVPAGSNCSVKTRITSGPLGNAGCAETAVIHAATRMVALSARATPDGRSTASIILPNGLQRTRSDRRSPFAEREQELEDVVAMLLDGSFHCLSSFA